MTTSSDNKAPHERNSDGNKFMDSALHFLASASNETLGACLVGLGALTYLVLGRVGLLLIGIVCGVTLHATWERNGETSTGHAAAEVKRRRDIGLEIVHRILDWRERNHSSLLKNDETQDIDVLLSSGKGLDFYDFKPATGTALSDLVDAVIRDYVK